MRLSVWRLAKHLFTRRVAEARRRSPARGAPHSERDGRARALESEYAWEVEVPLRQCFPARVESNCTAANPLIRKGLCACRASACSPGQAAATRTRRPEPRRSGRWKWSAHKVGSCGCNTVAPSPLCPYCCARCATGFGWRMGNIKKTL